MFGAQRVCREFSVPRVGAGLEVHHSWCQYDDAVANGNKRAPDPGPNRTSLHQAVPNATLYQPVIADNIRVDVDIVK